MYLAEELSGYAASLRFADLEGSTLSEAKDDFLNRRKGQKRKSSRSLTFSGTRFRVPPPA